MALKYTVGGKRHAMNMDVRQANVKMVVGSTIGEAANAIFRAISGFSLGTLFGRRGMELRQAYAVGRQPTICEALRSKYSVQLIEIHDDDEQSLLRSHFIGMSECTRCRSQLSIANLQRLALQLGPGRGPRWDL